MLLTFAMFPSTRRYKAKSKTESHQDRPQLTDRRWLHAKVYETIAHDLRISVRVLEDRDEEPSAAILDGRTLRSTRESGARAGYDGHKKKRGSSAIST